jgi:hypothetical protein
LLSKVQLRAREVMVGHQHLQPQGIGLVHALDAGDAVVHGDQDVGALLVYALRDRRSQAVAIDHAIGYEVVHVRRTQQAHAAYGHRAGGGAVAVVVGDDADALALGDRIGQQAGRGLHPQEAVWRQQAGQAIV